jgi:hypothetical protein
VAQLTPAIAGSSTVGSKALSQSADFRTLANRRVREARLLLRGSEWSGAYYVVGYAVECGFKAYLTKSFRSFQMPDKIVVAKCHTHDLDALANLSNLDGSIQAAGQVDPAFAVNWNVVKVWRETSRYETRTQTQAQEMFHAVTNRNHGVLPWLKRHW